MSFLEIDIQMTFKTYTRAINNIGCRITRPMHNSSTDNSSQDRGLIEGDRGLSKVIVIKIHFFGGHRSKSRNRSEAGEGLKWRIEVF